MKNGTYQAITNGTQSKGLIASPKSWNKKGIEQYPIVISLYLAALIFNF
jgi:hypothetical protein